MGGLTTAEIVVGAIVLVAVFAGGGWLAHTLFHWNWAKSVVLAPLVLVGLGLAFRYLVLD
ncbi:MAG: hypothetical protein ACXWUG_11095 [Polyangiales bacterium]